MISSLCVENFSALFDTPETYRGASIVSDLKQIYATSGCVLENKF